MSSSLVIVESPTKVKTIKKFLGPDFDVRATMGHVKDLPKSALGIDLENDFTPSYRVIESKKKLIAEIKKAAQKAEHIYLAPDPDREGEAIAWHIAEEIGGKNKHFHRTLFNDLTRKTVLEAIDNPLVLDRQKFEAQQTRRILDRLVGYKISPLLWEKVKRGLSAGRVQSVAVRLICDREKEISAFVSEEYWNITATLASRTPPPFDARLIRIEAKKAKVTSGEEAARLVDELGQQDFVVGKVDRKEVKRNPLPPFTTSKLQQEASRWLRFSAKKTMNVAQQLYEGVELGPEGSVGLITYMRTDSVRISDEAIQEVRNYIRNSYNPEFLPTKPRAFKNNAQAQDAHEAIRPSSLQYRPGEIKHYLTPDQYKLYLLIWNRFVASQMSSARYDQTVIDINAGRFELRAQGSIMKFAGYTEVYREGKDDNGGDADNETGKILPDVSVGEILKLEALVPEQKFTQPPPRFSEATLVRELEEKGIGRPSTYAAILATIQDREYVLLEKGRFQPTELGMLVNDLLVENFPKILDVSFTASLEDRLDLIEAGKNERIEILKEFYAEFSKELQAAGSMKSLKGKGIPTDMVCEKCGSPMAIKWGRNGRFIACTNYPDCRNTMNIPETGSGNDVKNGNGTPELVCEKCGKPMVLKQGRFGKFMACSGYPDCKTTVKITSAGGEPVVPKEEILTDKLCEQCGKPLAVKDGRYGKFLGCTGYPACKVIHPLHLGIPCPEDGCTGFLSERRSKTGRTFFGCTRYPDCKFVTWYRPLPEPCPKCGASFLVEKRSKSGNFKQCLRKDCRYKIDMGDHAA
ncbi:MAG TPA: type I DNA topoisomerase [Syntrophales bacterium]|jgi:DNA topoisomerase-1|nr:type I DNA topoisomerase [Syntrophales bacterium]HON22399.1 type I DNA topoisomerase [Syntrophales bacterium]HOU77161.1 type I DNA topoisomerase [Syntrophales bacterium]HPC32074.1 type I DNA topoisomerase [Syntrophales bacterium]HQG35215.1 type I DNA topoisomerase [Syntrophales bacterium]